MFRFVCSCGRRLIRRREALKTRGISALKVLSRIVLGVCLVALASACQADITISDAFCRGGQVFLHWSDPDTSYTGYNVYRRNQPIDSAEALNSAELVVANARLHSAKDLTASYIAGRLGQQDPNIGLRLSDLGPTLDPLDCLEVMTVRSSGQGYYAIVGLGSDGEEDRAVVPGVNSLTSPVDEVPGSPVPVLETEGSVNVSGYIYPWKTYTWYRRSDEAMRDGEATKVTVTLPANQASQYPTMYYLHAYGGRNNYTVWWNTIVIAPCDYTPGLPYTGNSWWYGYCNSYPCVSSGIVINYTENMLVHMLEWAKASFPVDPNRIILSGGSMGGTGSVSFGMRHPELFAGIYATVPQVNPGLKGMAFQDQLDDIWGPVSLNLPTDEGTGVWNRMNMTQYVADHKEDLPFLKVQNSKNDTVLFWPQIPEFYRNLNASRHGAICAWGQGGHLNSSSGLPPAFLNWDIYSKVRLNQSYVAVSNSSANDDPGGGDPLDGDSVGQMNSGYDWTILSDTADQWSALIKYTAGGAAHADISARRLQSFNFAAGDVLAYSQWNPTTGGVAASGRVTAERNRFFVIPHLTFDAAGMNLAVWKSSKQTTADVAGLDPGAPVDLDQLVVTAVFTDVCYAQPSDRVPAIAILGATGLSQGSLIRLRGTKAVFGQMTAVNASPALVPSYGKVAAAPIGIPRALETLQGKPTELGLLVKTWGVVERSGTDWFTLTQGATKVLVYGSIGSPAPSGLVAVTGIVSETNGPNGERYGVRVRSSSDVVRLLP